MRKVFFVLLIFTPLALLAAAFHFSPTLVFFLSAIAIIPLATYIGEATEHITSHTHAGLGGFLNATFGNITELIVSVFAIRVGLLEVVKAAIIGSVLGNVLLVLGTAIVVGGMRCERQLFNATAAKAGASLLLLASLSLVMPAIFQFTSTPNAAHPNTLMWLSVIVSVLMIIAYLAQLFFMLGTHKHLYNTQGDAQEIGWSMSRSLLVLTAATIAIALVSDTFVNSITNVVTTLGWTQLFIGVIVVAIVGNAAEHMSAIQAAVRNHMDLALGITIGSATQIVMFVAPILCLLSFFLGHPMNLVFNLFELIAFIFAVFVTNAIIEDGQTNWLEGVQLLTAYGILAVAFYLYV
jgi:Ca2+:H+ antiporter